MATDTSTRTYKWFWLVTIALLLIFLYMIKAILLPFVVGLGVAYFLDPAADRLEAWGLSRTVSTVIITLAFFFIVITGLVALTPLVYQQLSGLLDEMPRYIDVIQQTYKPKLEYWMMRIGQPELSTEAFENISSDVAKTIGKFVSGILRSGATILNVVSLLVITPVVTFYLLRDWDRMVAKLDTLLPRRHADVIREQMKAIDHTLSSFVRGQLNVCMIIGTYYAIALSLAGLEFGIIIGLLAGFLIIIPYVGTAVSGMLAVGIAYVQFDDFSRVLIVLAVFVLGQMVEGYFITPKLVGDKVGLHPVWLIFGMLAGGALIGFVGVLLAIPVSAIIGVLARFAISQYKESDIYKKDGVSRRSTQTKKA